MWAVVNGPAGDPDVRRTAHTAVTAALHHHKHGPLPPVGSPTWMTAPWQVQVTTLAIAGLSALLTAEQEAHAEAEAVKEAGAVTSADGRWSTDRCGPSAGDLAARRGDRWAYCAWPECRQKVKVPRCTHHR